MTRRTDSRFPPPSDKASFHATGYKTLGRAVDGGVRYLCEAYHAHPSRRGAAGNEWRLVRVSASAAASKPTLTPSLHAAPATAAATATPAAPDVSMESTLVETAREAMPTAMVRAYALRAAAARLGVPIPQPEEGLLTDAIEGYPFGPYLSDTVRLAAEALSRAVFLRTTAKLHAIKHRDGRWRSAPTLLTWLSCVTLDC